MNNISKIPGNIPILNKQRPFGFELKGVCQKCKNQNICTILRHIGSMQIPMYPEDFELVVQRCKWENPIKEGS